MKTAVFISEDAVYVVSKNENNEQSIFNIGSHIVFGNCSQAIVEMFKKFGDRQVPLKKLLDFARNSVKTGELYICGKSVFRVDKNGINEIKNSRTPYVVCSSVPYSLMADYANQFLKENPDEPQFGFVCSKSAKTLYPEDTKLYLIPAEYSSCGRFDETKNQKNTLTYNSLKSHLESLASLSERSPKARSQKKEIENRIRHETYCIINDYLVPKLFSSVLKKTVMSEDELSDLVNEDVENLIVSFRKKSVKSSTFDIADDSKHENAQSFEKIYSGKAKTFKYSNSIVLTVEKKEADKIQDEIRNTDLVAEVRKPHIVRLPKPVTSPVSIKLTQNLDMWNLEMIGADEAWRKTKGNGVKVGIIDTGVDYNHPNLEDRFDKRNPGFDFVRNSRKPFDFNGHGTHVAGTVAGKLTGVAPEASLYALRVLDSYGSGSEIDVILALEWAIDHKLDVVNMSIGFPYESMPLGEACSAAIGNGVLVCAAAGNDPYEACFPGDYSFRGVVSFAAVDKNSKRPVWSRLSDNNDLSAPGVDIVSSLPDNKYAIMSGTSMATPHGAGSAALVMSYSKQDPENIENMLEKCAEQIGDRKKYGFGLVRPDLVLMAQRKNQLIAALR